MAEFGLGLAKSALEGTVSMARSAIKEDKNLKKAVKRDLMLISDEFEMMQAFLEDAKGLITDNVTTTMVRQVRNMALDVEDCIESVVHFNDKSNWLHHMLPPCLPAAAPAVELDSVVADMQLLKERVEAIGHRNSRYSSIGGSGPKPGDQTHHHQVIPNATSGIFANLRFATEKQSSQIDLVQLINNRYMHLRGKEPEKQVEEALHPSPSSAADVLQLQVISVLGTRNDLAMMLVKKTYDNEEICQSFKCRAWVKLMHPFNPYAFMRSLLAQFYSNQCPQQDVEKTRKVKVARDGALIEAFENEISDHKYLVVLEDVSTMADWEAVRVYLPDKNNSSCIIVCDQLPGTASLCVGHPHRVWELEKFSTDHSVYVFCKQDVAVVDKKNIAGEWLAKNKIVGREMDLHWLSCFVRRIIKSEVFSLWGISGVGISFLAKHYYYQLQHANHYPQHTFGWVNISHPFNLMDFTRNLLLDLNPGYLCIMSTVKDPIQECREYLKKHDCFIVIDGLQSIEEWDMPNAALDIVQTDKKHVVIVITNEQSVAKHCASHYNNVHNVKYLEFDPAIELFKENQIKDFDFHSNNVRATIVHKCGGLPKVICAVAGMSTKYSFWNTLMKDNLVSSMAPHGEPFMITTADDADLRREKLEELSVWLLSYFRSCPDVLKPCIFYLSIFPLNHAIRRRRLVRRWVAEGYSRDDKEITAELDGERSFFKLASLSMVQVLIPLEYNWRWMHLCRVNGFLREYMISRSMEDNLVFALDDNSEMGLQRTGRHLAIYKSWDRDKNVFESIDFSRLRSMTVFGKWEKFFLSDKMRLLRVLDLEDVCSGLTNGDIDKIVELLPRLKFLSLRRCREITHLPDSLGDLKQLQTLDIRDTCVTRLPENIIKLKKLQYMRAGRTTTMDNDALMVQDSPAAAENPSSSDADTGMVERQTQSSPAQRPGATLALNWLSKLFKRNRLDDDGHGSHNGVKVPRGIGNLSSMHTLGVVNISADDDEGTLDELKNLTQLYKLGVSGINKNNADKLFSAISHLIHLESLSLHLQGQLNEASCLEGISKETIERLWGGSLKLYLNDCKLPEWTRNFWGPRKLSLHKTKLTQEDIFLLPSLLIENLRLFLSEFQDGMLQFDELHSLHVVHLEISCNSRSHAKITFAERMQCCIKVLRIRCPHVSSLQISGLRHIDGLKEVWISGPCDDDHKQRYQSELALYRFEEGNSKPVLRLEELGSSTIPWLVTTRL